MTQVGFEVAVILALIVANGFFALSELALVSARRAQLQEKSEAGSKTAKRALKLMQTPDKFLAAVQIGITVVGTLASVYGGATIVAFLTPKLEILQLGFLSEHAEGFAVTLVVIAISFLSIVLGELAPKYIALTYPEAISAGVSGPISLMTRVFRLFIPIFTGSAKLVVRLFGITEIKRASVVSEMDVHLLLAEGRESGVFDEEEEKLVLSALDFADTTAREAMTPRADIVAFDSSKPFSEIYDTIIEEGYSRYPIYEGSIDKIVGLVFLKDIILKKKQLGQVSLNDVMRPPFFVPDSMELADVLQKMKIKREHLAICLDDFGGTAGIITLEDILEELVGEIQDETDTEVAEYTSPSDKTAYISGTLRPDQLNERFGSQLPEDQSSTVAGMVVSKLGRIPAKQEQVKFNGIVVTVLEVEGSRIVRMRVDKATPAPAK